MPVEHDCGGGCSCSDCNGCIRWGTRCIIFHKRVIAAADSMAEAGVPEEKISLQEKVTLNISNSTLADVAFFLGNLVREPIGVPAQRVREQVSFKARSKPLSEVVEKLGLVKLPRRRATKTRAS